MAAAALVSYPSMMDIDSGLTSPPGHRPKDSWNQDGGSISGSSGSTDSSSDLGVTVAAEEQQARNQAQREAFNQYLKASESRLVTESERADVKIAKNEYSTSKKIIDEVRRYQQELFEKALEENVIAVLDTGSGKTLIACLLIRHMLAEELVRRAKGESSKVVFFLANSVHLVQQQARVLQSNLAVQPLVFVGTAKAEAWKLPQTWSEIYARNVPIFCTPAILLHCLDAALLRIDQISLLVFDEAHHAKKDHPYSKIIRLHYVRCNLDSRPRIFGMTASPVDSKEDIDKSIGNLEALLNSKIITTDDPSKMSFVPRPTNAIWRYPKLMTQPETALHGILKDKLKYFPGAEKGFIFAHDAVTTLGPWCADKVWKYITGVTEFESGLLVKRLEQSDAFIAMQSVQLRTVVIGDIQEAVMLVSQNESQMPRADGSHLSPKVLKLYQELFKIYSAQPQTRTIVFVDQRLTANVLNDCFTQLAVPNLRSAVLLGTAQGSASLKQQERFLDYFRQGLINLIFATSVADEGIDIPQCNLCVRFDLYKSPIQFIQSRGRARSKNSIYAHFIEEDNAKHENDLTFALNCDKYIAEYCRRLDPDRLLGHGTKLEQMIAQDSTKKSFQTITGAVCNFDNALIVLSRFASSLRHLGTIEQESYEEEIDEVNKAFRYLVRLPTLTEVKLTGALGDWKPNKQLAKRSAAWNCCFRLRQRGLLDDGLNSPFKKIKPSNLNARLAISGKTSAYPMMVKPSAWQTGLGSTPTDLYATIVHLNPSQPLLRTYSSLVFLTRVPVPVLPRFVVYLEETIETEVSFTMVNQKLAINANELEVLTSFTLEGVFQDVYNKSYASDATCLSYWLAPLSTICPSEPAKISEIVDMEALAEVSKGRIRWSAGTGIEGIWTNKFICDPKNGNFHYLTGGVAQGVSINDPVPAWVPQIPQKSRRNIIDFSDSHWKASKNKHIESTWDPSQQVLTAELLTARRNYLEPKSGKERADTACFIAPQPLEVSRLPPGFAATCFVWPSIIHRLESYMIVLEAFEKLDLPGVNASLALEAFTKDHDNEDQEHQIHIGGHHGMGKNYERLEFIGDSLLKMMTTISVFLRTNCDEEGMHCRRMEILCNRRLFEVSTEKHRLFRYIRTEGFNRVTWYPENMVLLKGRGAKTVPEAVKHVEKNQDLGMKTIADVSEAIIGASIIASRGAVNQFDLGIKAITQLVDSEDHTMTSWSDIATMYEAPDWALNMDDVKANQLAVDIGTRTGYHFRHPRLLRSAFTHSSDTNALVPDLQRLEFLGDAVLDWVSISWLFDTNPNRNPQWLTEHKMAMVSNKFLAALAVVLDFDKFLYCSTATLFADVTRYARCVREGYAAKDVNRAFWMEIESPPKALSDLVESYIGALFVDSGFDYSQIEKFFNSHVLWFFEDISRYDSFANRHPTTYLYKKLGEEFKCHDFSVMAADTDENQVEPKVTAGVLIHNKVIADASGISAKYAKVRASQRALAKLQDMTIEEFRREFGCYCKFDKD